MGGKEVDKELSGLICECVKASGAKIEESTANPFLYTAGQADKQPEPAPFIGMDLNQMAAFKMQQTMEAMRAASNTSPEKSPSDGPWTCSCGQTGLTCKFCPECGNPRC